MYLVLYDKTYIIPSVLTGNVYILKTKYYSQKIFCEIVECNNKGIIIKQAFTCCNGVSRSHCKVAQTTFLSERSHGIANTVQSSYAEPWKEVIDIRTTIRFPKNPARFLQITVNNKIVNEGRRRVGLVITFLLVLCTMNDDLKELEYSNARFVWTIDF